jgi:hypothetical protein
MDGMNGMHSLNGHGLGAMNGANGSNGYPHHGDHGADFDEPKGLSVKTFDAFRTSQSPRAEPR